MKKIIFSILASVWFFPISCTTFTFTGAYLSSLTATRYMENGEKPYSIFYILRENIHTLEVEPILWSEFQKNERTEEDYTLLLTADAGLVEFESNGVKANINYERTTVESDSYEYSLVYSDLDYSARLSYLVSEGEVSPKLSRVYGPGHGIIGFFIAIPLAMFIHYLFRHLLKRRQHAA